MLKIPGLLDELKQPPPEKEKPQQLSMF
jgi:hypothetical protein